MVAGPLISVVMSVYNGERYLEEAIKSILNQTFGDFEFIIINDGSSDSTSILLDYYKKADTRIHVFNREENRGLAVSLNEGCRAARGEYIARMDADDVSLPERLNTQVEYLGEHPKVAMLGSSAVVIDDHCNTKGLWTVPCDDLTIRWLLLFGNPFIHSTIMMRRMVLDRVGYYSEQVVYAQDYDLWSRIADICGVGNVEEPLIKWRATPLSISALHSQEQEEQWAILALRNICALLGINTLESATWDSLRNLLLRRPGTRVNMGCRDLLKAVAVLRRLQSAFYRRHNFPRRAIRNHRKRLYDVWAKRFLALAYRHNGKRGAWCRVTLLALGIRFLCENLVTLRMSSLDVK